MRIPYYFVVSLTFLAVLQAANREAQNTVVSYQGRVLDNGTNFNGAGQFEFALVTSTNTSSPATAQREINIYQTGAGNL